METFKTVDIRNFVKQGLSSGILKPREAEKIARIRARQGQIGEIINTYSQNGILETTNKVGLDPITQQPDWIISKIIDGEIVIDEFGHTNEYIISDSKFKILYEKDPQTTDLFRSTSGKQIFVQTPMNISFNATWGEPMNILAGGYLNITKLDDIYGIQERDFYDTYQFTDEKQKKL